MATMADVARVAGVSVSTVSHVINGTRPVNEATRTLVLDAVERTGYVHNTLARALATGGTNSIGVALSMQSNPYFTELLDTIEDGVSAAGYTLLLGDTHEEIDQELRVVRMLRERRVDGLLVAPSSGARGLALTELAAAGVPAVLVDRLVSPDFDQVGGENIEATASLVAHLAGHGHHRIAMIAGRSGLTTTAERVAGFRKGLAACGLPVAEELILDGGSVAERAHEAVVELLQRPDSPTALVSGNNAMTIGVMRALRMLGRRVPDDVAFAVFDDFEWADLFSPRLTAIAQPVQQIGAEAVRLLMSRIADPTIAPRTLRLRPRLIVRESCGCGADEQ